MEEDDYNERRLNKELNLLLNKFNIVSTIKNPRIIRAHYVWIKPYYLNSNVTETG